MSKSNRTAVSIPMDIINKASLNILDHLRKNVIPDLPNTPPHSEVVIASLLSVASSLMESYGMAAFKYGNYIMAIDPNSITEEDEEDTEGDEGVLDIASLGKRVFH